MNAARFGAVAAALSFCALGAQRAEAGPYSDDLARCLVSSTTPADKGGLVKWIFSIASLHPQLSTASTVTTAQRDELNRNLAALFETLLTDKCRAQTQAAVRYEGPGTIEASFSVLGEAAMMELFSDKGVSQGMGAFAKYLHEEKLREVLNIPKE